MLIISYGCEEFLPQRNDPSDAFRTTITYSLNLTPARHKVDPEQMMIFITVKNNYDEVIQAPASFEGEMKIEWTPPIEAVPQNINMARTIKINSANIFYSNGYNPITGIFTFSPGDSIVFFAKWNLKTDDSTNLFKQFYWLYDHQCYVYSLWSGPSDGGPRRISKQQPFLVSAKIKLFDKTAILFPNDVKFNECLIWPYYQELNDPQTNPCHSIFGSPCDQLSP